jgi:hypothetical protein
MAVYIQKKGKVMTVREFCRKKTQALELCIVRDSGWIVQAVWIDHEDLFGMSQRYENQEVKSDEWGTIPIITEHGDKIEIPCHYIDID